MSPTLVIVDGTRVMMSSGPTGGRLEDIAIGGVAGRRASSPVSINWHPTPGASSTSSPATPPSSPTSPWPTPSSAATRRLVRPTWETYRDRGQVAKSDCRLSSSTGFLMAGKISLLGSASFAGCTEHGGFDYDEGYFLDPHAPAGAGSGRKRVPVRAVSGRTDLQLRGPLRPAGGPATTGGPGPGNPDELIIGAGGRGPVRLPGRQGPGHRSYAAGQPHGRRTVVGASIGRTPGRWTCSYGSPADARIAWGSLCDHSAVLLDKTLGAGGDLGRSPPPETDGRERVFTGRWWTNGGVRYH